MKYFEGLAQDGCNIANKVGSKKEKLNLQQEANKVSLS